MQRHQRHNLEDEMVSLVTVHGVRLPTFQEALTTASTTAAATPTSADTTNTTSLLRLNGYGLRKFTFYGVSMDMYVAACYSSHELRHPGDVLEVWNRKRNDHNDNTLGSSRDSQGDDEADDGRRILSLNFHFLQAVPQSRMRMAWSYQMDWHVDHDAYDGSDGDLEASKARFAHDKKAFLDLLGGLKKHQQQSVQMHWNVKKNKGLSSADTSDYDDYHHDCETIVLEQGQVKGHIRGPHFQRAFLSMWFGQKPVTEQLKEGFLMGSTQSTAATALAR